MPKTDDINILAILLAGLSALRRPLWTPAETDGLATEQRCRRAGSEALTELN